jgi:hypothetical protein
MRRGFLASVFNSLQNHEVPYSSLNSWADTIHSHSEPPPKDTQILPTHTHPELPCNHPWRGPTSPNPSRFGRWRRFAPAAAEHVHLIVHGHIHKQYRSETSAPRHGRASSDAAERTGDQQEFGKPINCAQPFLRGRKSFPDDIIHFRKGL